MRMDLQELTQYVTSKHNDCLYRLEHIGAGNTELTLLYENNDKTTIIEVLKLIGYENSLNNILSTLYSTENTETIKDYIHQKLLNLESWTGEDYQDTLTDTLLFEDLNDDLNRVKVMKCGECEMYCKILNKIN